MPALAIESPYVHRVRRARPACRLVCVPHAGAGASVFSDWAGLLPERVELVAIQLPGREERQFEAPFDDLKPLVRVLVQVLRPYLGVRVALLGHCAGALLAFELARELRRRLGAEPSHLFVASHAAPHLPSSGVRLSGLPDGEFRTQLGALGGTPPAVLENTELWNLMLPSLRADVALWEGYRYVEDEPLTCPITAFGGAADEGVNRGALEAWRPHTTGAFRLHVVQGGHFIVGDAAAELTRAVTEEL